MTTGQQACLRGYLRSNYLNPCIPGQKGSYYPYIPGLKKNYYPYIPGQRGSYYPYIPCQKGSYYPYIPCQKSYYLFIPGQKESYYPYIPDSKGSNGDLYIPVYVHCMSSWTCSRSLVKHRSHHSPLKRLDWLLVPLLLALSFPSVFQRGYQKLMTIIRTQNQYTNMIIRQFFCFLFFQGPPGDAGSPGRPGEKGDFVSI